MPDLAASFIATPAAAQSVFVTLQQRAQDLAVRLRLPPPEPNSCCGRGCNGCVWEGFYTATAFWQEDALEAIAAAQATKVPTASAPSTLTHAAPPSTAGALA